MLMAETPNSKSQVPISSHVRDPCYAWWNWIIERCSLFVVEGAVAQIRISGFFRVSDFGLRISGSEQFELDIYLESLSAGALVAGTERFFHSKISVPQVKRPVAPAGPLSATELNRAAVASSKAC